MRFLRCGVALLLLGAQVPAAGTSIPTLGLHIEKPAGWQVLTAEANAENLRSVEMQDDTLQQAVARYATAPVIAFTKYQEPYPDLNPSIKINARTSGGLAGRDPKDILALILPTIENAFQDVIVQQAPIDTQVSSLPAAYARLSYTLQAGGREFPTTSELWIVPRGSYFFIIGAGTRQDEANGTRAEVRSIVDSIRIDHLP